MKYNAFISYSHRQDSDLAPSLEKALETFAKPIFKRRALNIFRDSNDLSASPDLWGKIEDGLSQSDYFIFLASPAAAQSRWCKKEVAYWKEHKSMDHFLIVLTEGELFWDESRSDFDWTKTTSIPENLSGALHNEPLYVDFRNKISKEDLTLQNPEFKSKTVLLAATLHGKAVGDMVGEGVKQHKRTLLIRNSAIAVLSALLIASGFLTHYAFEQKEIAEEQTKEALRQTKEALRQTNRALAKSYLSDSKANLDLDPTISLRLAEYAYTFAKTKGLDLENHEDQLIKAYYNNSNFYLEHDDFQLKGQNRPLLKMNGYELELNKNTDQLFLITPDGKWLPFPDFETEGFLSEVIGFSPKGKFILTNSVYPGGSYAGTQNALNVHDLEWKQKSVVSSYVPIETRGPHHNKIVFDANETRFLITGETPGTTLYDFRETEMTSKLLHESSTDVLDIALRGDGNQVALAKKQGIVNLIDFSDYGLFNYGQWDLRGHNLEEVDTLSYGQENRYIFTKSVSIMRKWHAHNELRKRYIDLEEGINAYELDTIPLKGNEGIMTIREANKDELLYEIHKGDSLEVSPYVMTHINKLNDTITTFHAAGAYSDGFEGESNLNHWNSPNGRYYATRNGLFNKRGELLISYNEQRHTYKHNLVLMAFSLDSKYLFMVDKIYIMDAETILSRINDVELSGAISKLDVDTKSQYLIED